MRTLEMVNEKFEEFVFHLCELSYYKRNVKRFKMKNMMEGISPLKPIQN